MHARLVLAASAALILGTLTAAPAEADVAAPSVESVDAATPGLVTALAHTDQSHVAATITGDFADAVMFPVVDGAAAVSLETWGFGPAATLSVAACSSATYEVETCSVGTDTAFAATPATPVIDWPEDTSVGPGGTFEMTSTDSSGGGTLVALIDNGVDLAAIPIDRNGTTDLTGHLDGAGTVTLTRCSAAHPDICNPTFTDGPIESPFARYTSTPFMVDPVNAPLTQAAPSASLTLRTPLRGAYSLSYHFESEDVPDVPGATGLTGTVPSDIGIFGVAVDGAGLTDGAWEIVVSLAVKDTDFDDDFLPATEQRVPITVDRSGPTAEITLDRSEIHPRISGLSGYPNSVTATATGDTDDIAGWVIRRPSNAPDDHTRTFPAGDSITWNGKYSSGQVVGPGTFHIHTRDALGNLSTTFAAVVVTSKHVITTSFVRDVKAGPTVVDRYVGRCSTLQRPSARRWAGSLGFYANTRCPNTAVKASLVSTVHGVTVPKAYTYTYVRVSAYAGAKRSHPRSKAVLRYLTDTGKWRFEFLMKPTFGWKNPAVPPSANAYIDSNNRLYWGVYTLSGHRYDVAKFKVQVKYRKVVD